MPRSSPGRSNFSPTQTAILSLLNWPSIEGGHKVQQSELLIGCERRRSATIASMAMAAAWRSLDLGLICD
ncbi:hypothetical protein TIFTF001_027864 [Ficus carica]|uniref:Uncharacterized protein n=1 Tax=Ficus carica TaxID=3494 RepID=A0AA88DPZ3_FICCA|nr:hypothetical protein TIFTF001_027864 [Ficus carica]